MACGGGPARPPRNSLLLIKPKKFSGRPAAQDVPRATFFHLKLARRANLPTGTHGRLRDPAQEAATHTGHWTSAGDYRGAGRIIACRGRLCGKTESWGDLKTGCRVDGRLPYHSLQRHFVEKEKLGRLGGGAQRPGGLRQPPGAPGGPWGPKGGAKKLLRK